MRGEHAVGMLGIADLHGSSPHARGTPTVGFRRDVHERFIPACAGNTPGRPPTSVASSVHPRMRGEHSMSRRNSLSTSGSSPHARGTPRHRHPRRGLDRFIPACAGNTGCDGRRTARSSVHPRMRGEQLNGRSPSLDPAGSSPHARGTRGHCVLHVRPPSVHPRMRGEHGSAAGFPRICAGSSPHARGTPFLRGAERPDVRFIPACAGNTNRKPVRHVGQHGSSPHARGTPRVWQASRQGRRFIPACAGNTATWSTHAR